MATFPAYYAGSKSGMASWKQKTKKHGKSLPPMCTQLRQILQLWRDRHDAYILMSGKGSPAGQQADKTEQYKRRRQTKQPRRHKKAGYNVPGGRAFRPKTGSPVTTNYDLTSI